MFYLDPPNIEAQLTYKNLSTIELSSIIPSTGWDYFSINATPSIPQTVLNESLSNLPLQISGLNPGFRYNFSVSVFIANNCEYGLNRPSTVSVAACTVPGIPFINSEDQRSVAVVNQTSITLIGSQINYSDLYIVHGLWENGTRVDQLTQIWSGPSNDTLTLSNLTAGKSYTVELISVIGTSTDCGGSVINSDIKAITICTDPPDIEAVFVDKNATSIELSHITPRSGWDYFSVQAIPSLQWNISNKSFSALPLQISGLNPGAQYKFSVSVEISTYCDYGTNDPSSVAVLACTAPYAPFVSPGRQFSVAVVNQTSITLIGISINSSDTYAVVGLLANGTDVPEFTRIQAPSVMENVTISNLTSGISYSVEVVSVIGTTTDCGARSTSDSSGITSIHICTDPPKIGATLVQLNTTTIQLKSINPKSGWDSFSITVSPNISQQIDNKPASRLPLEISGLQPGSQYTFDVSVEISINCEFGINHPTSDIKIICTAPLTPYISSQNQLSAFIVNQTSITIIGSSLNSSDAYAVVGLLENGTRISQFERIQLESTDDNLTLNNLSPGSRFALEMVSVIGTKTNCGIGNSTDSEIVSFKICTDPPNIQAVFIPRNITTVEMSSIIPNAGWDYFSIETSPSIDQTIINETILMLPLQVSGLVPGAQYLFNVSVTISSFCDFGANHPSSVIVTTCTVPNAPYIDPQDQLSVAIVNQSSITLIGRLIKSSDTYAVVGLLENGVRVTYFTRIQSESADGNVILNNLSAGKSYNVEFISVIGTSTDCGGITLDSFVTSVTICTDPYDIEANFVQINATTIELSSITPNTGWDYFSVDANPSIPQTIFNESTLTWPLQMSGLVPGTQYNFTVSVAIGARCEIGTNHPSSVTATICTAPNAPYISSEDQLSASIANQTSITLIGSGIVSSDTYAVLGLLEDEIRVLNFTRLQSKSAEDNVTLVNLVPGKSYTLEVVSVIGTNTECGKGNTTDSEITEINVCTALADVTLEMSTENADEIWLRNITPLPLSGRDYFNVTAIPSLPEVFTNQSSLPLQFTGLSFGTEYSFTVTLSNWYPCINNARSSTSTTTRACTEPHGPQLQGVYHSATTNSIIINAHKAIVSPIAGQLDAYSLSHTVPLGGVSAHNYTSVNGGFITITGLSPGTVYTADFYGILNRTSCGGVVTGGPSGIKVTVHQLCTVPSNPQISSGALSSTEDTIALSIDKVFSPVGELRDTIKVTDVIQHPGGQNFSDDEWSSANESDILIRGLTPGTRYTLFIVSTLGDGNTSCDTNQDGRTDNILRSTPSVVTGCTRPPMPLIRITGINSTAIEVGINNTIGFDTWSATLEGDNGTQHSSANYTSRTQSHIFSSGLSPGGGYYTVGLTFYLGGTGPGETTGGTDCGDMGTLTSTTIKTDVIVGCDEPPLALINAVLFPNDTLVVSVDNPSTSFDTWTVSVQSQLSQTETWYNLTSTQSHVFPDSVKGTRYNITATLMNVGGGQNCGLFQSKQRTNQLSLCTAPDYINTSSLQFGSENGFIYFSGVSGVRTGSYDSVHFSLSSSIAHCSHQYQTIINDTNERQITDTLASGCTYDIEVWAQCGDVKGPSYTFPVYVPGDLKVTIIESWKNATSLVYLLQDLLSVQATLQTVTCTYLQFGSKCADKMTVNTINGDRSEVSVDNLTPGGLYQLVFEFSVGAAAGVHFETVYACLDPLDNLNWSELGANSSTYDITAIPTKCPVSTQSIVHLPNSALNLSLLEPGCEFRLIYSARCVLPNGTAINSIQLEHDDTFCSDPASPSTSLILDSSIEYELKLSGFRVERGFYDLMEVAVSTNCMQLWWNKNLFTNDTLELAELMPGCKYTFNYRALCFASREGNNGISETVVSDFCTVPRKPDLQTIEIKITPTNSTPIEALYEFGPISPNPVEPIEGYISHIQLRSYSPKSLIKNISPTAADVSHENVFVQVFPASEVKLSIEGVIEDCGGVSSNEVAEFTLCSQPEPPTNLQLTGVDFTSFTLSWTPPANGTIGPLYYQVSVTQHGEVSPFLAQNVSALGETPSSFYVVNTQDADGISLPSGTRFTCSVRTITPYSCDYGEVFGRVDIDNSVSASSVPCSTNGTGGQPLMHSYNFLNPSVVQINWTAPDDFVGVLDSDYYSVLVNGDEQRKVPASSQNLSTAVEGIELCSNYSVTIVPVRSGLNAKMANFDIRNWNKDTLLAEILSQFTEQAMLECGVCPNDGLSSLCEFPFDHGGLTNISTCIPFTRGGGLKCKDGKGDELTCHPDVIDSCKPEPPSLETATFETLVSGESVHLTWSVSSDFYNNFQIFINRELVAETIETEFNATNLSAGEDYNVKIVMNSFGRQSEQIITFTMTDSPQNVFASDMTTTSAQLNVDPFEQTEDKNNKTNQQNCTTEQLQVSQNISEFDYVTLFWTEEEIRNRASVETIDVANSFTLRNLSSGLFYCFEVTPIDNCTNEIKDNSSLTICAPTVPVQITESTNNLTLSEDSNKGIGLHLALTAGTAAEFIHVDTTCVATIANIIQSDGALLITVMEEQLASQNQTECRVFDCVDGRKSLDQEVISSEQREPGINCIVEIYSSTGVSESEHTTVTRYETPEPVENLVAYFSDETSIRVSWSPPNVGYFDHFIVSVTSLDQDAHQLNVSAKIDGYLRYVATGLLPGYSYQLSVYAAADPEGTVRSQAKFISEDTAPVPPESLTITEPENVLRSIRLSFDPPSGGKFGGFLVEVEELEDGNGERRKRSLNGGILEDSEVELPLKVGKNETSVELSFANYGSVYSVTLRSLSPNQKPSIASANQNIMTDGEAVLAFREQQWQNFVTNFQFASFWS
ncbi:uncharacterized protein LOC142337988 [Convolutriloba macropyga]|uniref:uncharacterized protein LOC142337988 n=1 Tax=Convolutriloba macropyga TaxID=536237 RepID=UPI003F51E0C5